MGCCSSGCDAGRCLGGSGANGIGLGVAVEHPGGEGGVRSTGGYVMCAGSRHAKPSPVRK